MPGLSFQWSSRPNKRPSARRCLRRDGLISMRHDCGSHPLAALESGFITGIDNLSALQRNESIGETACKLVVLSRQQQREAESAQSLDRERDFLKHDRRQALRWLIQQQQ